MYIAYLLFLFTLFIYLFTAFYSDNSYFLKQITVDNYAFNIYIAISMDIIFIYVLIYLFF